MDFGSGSGGRPASHERGGRDWAATVRAVRDRSVVAIDMGAESPGSCGGLDGPCCTGPAQIGAGSAGATSVAGGCAARHLSHRAL